MIVLDFLLILLTSAAILYSMLLNKRILRIQKYRSDMLGLFKEFDKTIVKSEQILASTLAQTSEIIEKSDKKINEMEKILSDTPEKLDFIVQKADKLSEELETIIMSGHKLFGRLSDTLSQSIESCANSEVVASAIDLEQIKEQEKLLAMDYNAILENKKKVS